MQRANIFERNGAETVGPRLLKRESLKGAKPGVGSQDHKACTRFDVLKFPSVNRGVGRGEGWEIILGKTADRVCCVDGHTYLYTCTYGGSRVLTTIRMCPCLLPVPRPRSRSGIQCNKTASPLTGRSFDRPGTSDFHF